MGIDRLMVVCFRDNSILEQEEMYLCVCVCACVCVCVYECVRKREGEVGRRWEKQMERIIRKICYEEAIALLK